MTVASEVNRRLLQRTYDVYGLAEAEILAAVKKRATKGLGATDWQATKLANVTEIRNDVAKILGSNKSLLSAQISKTMVDAYLSGVNSTNKYFGLPTNPLQDIIPQKVQRYILEAEGLVEGTSFQILRDTEDAYREIISTRVGDMIGGAERKTKVLQAALDNFAQKGITGFVDKAGRKWELQAYTDMALRTASQRAALQGHVDRQTELGEDLMQVSSVYSTCPICRPWDGRILSISGNSIKYPSLEQAKAAGLFHPNCMHTLLAYNEDYETIDKMLGQTFEDMKQNNDDLYKREQEQRSLERHIREWKRREIVAITPEAKAKAKGKVREWQAVAKAHADKYDLTRRYDREKIYVGDATRAKAIKEYKKIKVIEPVPSQSPAPKTQLPKIVEPPKVSQVDESANWQLASVDKMKDQLRDYAAGGHASVKDALDKHEYALMQHNYKKTFKRHYRIEDSSYTFEKQSLKKGDVFSFDGDARSFSQDEDFIKKVIEDEPDMDLYNKPVIFETVNEIHSFDMTKISPFSEQVEFIAGGQFEVTHIGTKTIAGQKVDVVYIMQKDPVKTLSKKVSATQVGPASSKPSVQPTASSAQKKTKAMLSDDKTLKQARESRALESARLENEATLLKESMSEKTYRAWQEENSTKKKLHEEISRKYDVELNKYGGVLKDRLDEDRGEWVSDLVASDLQDYRRVTDSRGYSYVTNADWSKNINAYYRSDGKIDPLVNYYHRGNTSLGKAKMLAEEARGEVIKTANALDTLISKSSLDRELVVERWGGLNSLSSVGVKTTGRQTRVGHAFITEGADLESVKEQIDKLAGTILTDKGYMSTSACGKLNVFKGSDVKFTIEVPKGKKAFVTDNIDESEVIFARGSQTEIVGSRIIETEAYDEWSESTVKTKTLEIFMRML